MIARLFIAGVFAVLSSNSAFAQMNLATMQKAEGLSNIFTKAKPCGYQVDQPNLEKYLAANNLDSPEVLSYLSSSIDLAQLEEAPSPSQCTLAKSTARKIGILTE